MAEFKKGFIKGYGTYIVAAAFLLYGALGFGLDLFDWKEALQLVLEGAGLGYLRRAIGI